MRDDRVVLVLCHVVCVCDMSATTTRKKKKKENVCPPPPPPVARVVHDDDDMKADQVSLPLDSLSLSLLFFLLFFGYIFYYYYYHFFFHSVCLYFSSFFCVCVCSLANDLINAESWILCMYKTE